VFAEESTRVISLSLSLSLSLSQHTLWHRHSVRQIMFCTDTSDLSGVGLDKRRKEQVSNFKYLGYNH